MGEHTTEISLNLFNFLLDLGKTLDYHTYKEFPMSENAFGSQAIDVAWFNEQQNKFPLFIFEIESTSNNSIANNPTKIFGKESKVFEKPLFFFHVIIDGAEISEKYNDLIGLFGKYNYDIFRINNGETENLLIKIILQHRRIYNQVNIFQIIRLINDNDRVKSEIKFERFLENAENLIHENQSYRIGQVYADIASSDKSFLEQYFKFIKRAFLNKSLPTLSYETYYSSICSEFINLGILYSKFGKDLKNVDFQSLLIEAQKTETFDKIEYLPGLNYDYDNFIHDYVPYYIALMFFLFKGDMNAQKYILNIAIGIIRKLPITKHFIFEHHISWGILMSASNEDFCEFYEELKNLMNNRNGILDIILFCPTFINDHNDLPDSKVIIVPSRNEYIARFKNEFSHLNSDKDINEIAVMSLSENWKDELDYHYNLGVDLANLVIKTL